jgi:hypothetical protein
MSLITLILDLMAVGLALMLIGWVSDLLRSDPTSVPPSPSRVDPAEARRRASLSGVARRTGARTDATWPA